MANLKNRLMGHLYEMYRQGKGMKRKDDPENRYIHSHSTMQVYCREVERFTRWLRTQGVKSRCSDQEAAAHVQEYLDTLIVDGKSENSVHVAAAALSKVLHHVGVRMSGLEKPRRTAAPHKGRQEAPSLAGRRDAQMDSEEHERLVRFALAVGIRRSEYRNLRVRNLCVLDGYTYIEVERGKGGKRQLQRIDPVDAEFVSEFFRGFDPSAFIFSKSELNNKINLHALRREHAQAMYRSYVQRMEADPNYRAQLLYEVREAFLRAGEDWRTNRDMRRIHTPYFCRSGVRSSMEANGRAIRYDRLALMAVSVFHLAHWRADVTVKNYMQ